MVGAPEPEIDRPVAPWSILSSGEWYGVCCAPSWNSARFCLVRAAALSAKPAGRIIDGTPLRARKRRLGRLLRKKPLLGGAGSGDTAKPSAARVRARPPAAATCLRLVAVADQTSDDRPHHPGSNRCLCSRPAIRSIGHAGGPVNAGARQAELLPPWFASRKSRAARPGGCRGPSAGYEERERPNQHGAGRCPRRCRSRPLPDLAAFSRRLAEGGRGGALTTTPCLRASLLGLPRSSGLSLFTRRGRALPRRSAETDPRCLPRQREVAESLPVAGPSLLASELARPAVVPSAARAAKKKERRREYRPACPSTKTIGALLPIADQARDPSLLRTTPIVSRRTDATNGRRPAQRGRLPRCSALPCRPGRAATHATSPTGIRRHHARRPGGHFRRRSPASTPANHGPGEVGRRCRSVPSVLSGSHTHLAYVTSIRCPKQGRDRGARVRR